AAADARHQESLRLALWRMDSWLSAAVAVETKGWVSSVEAVHGVHAPPPTRIVKEYVRVGPGLSADDAHAALRDHAALWRRIDRGLARLPTAQPRTAKPLDVELAQETMNFNEQFQRLTNNANVQIGANGAGGEWQGASPSILVPMWVRQGDAD